MKKNNIADFFNKYTQAYFIGIGGMGMNALAKFFLSKNIRIAGYDAYPSSLTMELEKKGVFIQYDTEIDNIPKEFTNASTIVIYTPAVPDTNSILCFFQQTNPNLYKRAELLGLLSQYFFTIAIAGTHGKTTTTALVTHILAKNSFHTINFLGGISLNYEDNFIDNSKDTSDPIMVVEADEYDYSFLELKPDIAIITNIEPDHMELFLTEERLERAFIDFSHLISENGYLIIHEDIAIDIAKKAKTIQYGYNGKDYRIADTNYSTSKTEVNCITPKGNYTFTTSLSGEHNINNCLASIAVAEKMGITSTKIIDALQSFKGVHRRCQYIFNANGIVFIDDYAHHPTEVKCFLSSVKIAHPKKKISAIFQPKLHSRVKIFAKEFGEALSICDEVFIIPTYGAREEPIVGIDETLILHEIHPSVKKEFLSKKKVLDLIEAHSFEVLVTIGAGDISELVPEIKRRLEKKNIF